MNQIRYIINPLSAYLLSFSAALGGYFLYWSDLYPVIGLDTTFFLLSTFALSVILLIKFPDYFTFRYDNIEPVANYKKVMVFIVFCFFIEFAYNGSIPLLEVVTGNITKNYSSFGVPTFHVFVSTLAPFYGTYLFHCYLSTKKKIFLWYVLIMVAWFVFTFSRGGVLYMGLTFFVLYLLKNGISLSFMLKMFIFLVLLLYVFGVMGNARSGKDVSDVLMQWTLANDRYYRSGVPQPYYWAYLYVTSPLANFQITTDTFVDTHFTAKTILGLINSELVPDFISKRLFEIFGSEPIVMAQISDGLNVGTVYARAFAYLGWVGVVIIFLYLVLMNLVYRIGYRKDNPYYLSGYAVMISLFFFCMFGNMITFSGLSLQLIYPFLLPYVDKISVSFKR